MKSWINKTFVLTILSLVFFSCEKEGEEAVVKPMTAPTLESSAQAVELSEEREEEMALAFSWTPADYGFPAAVKYVLQVDVAGGDFSDPLNIEMGNKLEREFSVEVLNSTALKLGLVPDEEGQLIFRVVSTVSALVEPLTSSTISVALTPYSTFIEPTFIFAPGAYQGWDPGTAASLISVEDNGIYVGYVTFPDAESLKFKFTPERDWDMDFGQGATAGTLAERGPDLAVEKPGTYKITVDLNNMTWTATPYSWGVIGDATPGGWDADTDMTFDSEERVWRLTTDLTTGNIKFRLNDDWGINYGDDDTSNDALNPNGKDIPIAEAGTYEIVLNLQDPENPTYTLTKQ